MKQSRRKFYQIGQGDMFETKTIIKKLKSDGNLCIAGPKRGQLS